MFLIHTKTGDIVLLQRVILQIHKNKEKVLHDIKQGTVLIYAETTKLTPAFAIHFIFRQIVIMRGLKEGKQMGKLNISQAGQGTETLGIVFMIFIIHATKIRVYAIYDKYNLH